MTVFYKILWYNTIVLDPFLRQKINRVGLLQQGVACVLFVFQNRFDRAEVPPVSTSASEDTVRFQTFGYLLDAVALQVFPLDASYHLCLLRVDDQITVCIFCVAQKTVVIDLDMALLVAEL